MNSPHRSKRLSWMVVAATLIASATTYAQEHREGVRPRPTEFLRLKAQVEILEARIEQLEAQLTGGRRPARPRGARVVPLRREPSGESGAVYEHADRTKRIATARITFTSEDGSSKFETISGDEGTYRLPLSPGRYRVDVEHDEFDRYTTEEGFFVVHEGRWGTGNFFLREKGWRDKPFPLPMRREFPNQSDKPPTVKLTLDRNHIRLGETVELTLEATDDKCLVNAWWFGEQTGDPALRFGRALFGLDRTEVKQTWTLKPTKVGTFAIGANSRDSAYGRPQYLGEAHQASEGAGIPRVRLVVTKGTRTLVRP